MTDLATRLEAFRALESNWDSYGANPIAARAITTAQALTAVPMPHGGVQIELHAGQADIEIEISADGMVRSILMERTDG